MNARTALEIADKLDYLIRSVMSIHNVPTLPKLCDCGNDAADMMRQQHAEIERLKSQFDPAAHAHRTDCCGPQIDTHCMGCTMAEREAHAAEIDRLTTDLAESRRKSADLEISLHSSRDMALRAYGADVCPNCDTALPKGCEGVFANDHDCMWRKT